MPIDVISKRAFVMDQLNALWRWCTRLDVTCYVCICYVYVHQWTSKDFGIDDRQCEKIVTRAPKYFGYT